MAIWAVVTNLPLLIPGIMGASAFTIQLSVVVWFFLPLIAGFIRHYIGTLSARFRLLRASNALLGGYGILGITRAAIYVDVGLWIYGTPEMGWKRMYWPAYSAVQPGLNLLLQGGTLFCQYGHISLWSSVITLAVYTVKQDGRAPESSPTSAPASQCIASLIGVMIVFVPGAGAASLLYMLETVADRPLAVSNDL